METSGSFPAIACLVETGKGLRQGLGEVAEALYRNPRMYGLRSEDDVGELFSRYPGRIETILRKYHDSIEHFPGYLVATVRYLALTLKRDRARAFDRQAVFDENAIFCAEGKIPEFNAVTPYESPRAVLPEASGKGRYRRLSLRSRFLFLSLKCAWTSDDEFLARAAGTLGIDSREFLQKMADARARTYGMRDRWETRKAARDASWVRLRILERRLLREEDPCVQSLYRDRIAREKARFKKRLSEARAAKLLVSNRTISEVMGVSKGTVDAGLFHVARRIRDFQSPG